MKCPRCWANKVQIRRDSTWKRLILACLLLRPMKCRHCYHRFCAVIFLAPGKQFNGPSSRIVPLRRPPGPSRAAKFHAANQGQQAGGGHRKDRDSTSADAA